MRIGPKGPIIDPSVARPDPVAKPTTGTAPAEALRGLSPGAPAATPHIAAAQNQPSVDSSAMLDAIRGVLGRLRAGELAAQDVRQAIVDAAVEARGTTLSSRQQEALRGALEKLLVEDPHMSATLSRMTSAAERDSG